MATYQLICSNLRCDGFDWVGSEWLPMMKTDAVLIDENNNPRSPDPNSTDVTEAYVPLASIVPMEFGDTVEDLRQKSLAQLYLIFEWLDPENDTVVPLFF